MKKKKTEKQINNRMKMHVFAGKLEMFCCRCLVFNVQCYIVLSVHCALAPWQKLQLGANKSSARNMHC